MRDIRASAVDIATRSKIAKSSRRIFITGCDQTIEERGRWHADHLAGCSSSILLRHDYRFFLLTAKHVIDNWHLELDCNSPSHTNPTPFLTTAKSDGLCGKEITNMLLPIKHWKIGELIKDAQMVINTQDVTLIELGTILPPGIPDHFIDISPNMLTRKPNGFRLGEFLVTSGFSISTNPYDYTQIGEFTHSTIIKRTVIPGFCVLERGEPHLSFALTETNLRTHEDLNGFSGGVVFNVPKVGEPQWCGMVTHAGNNILRFIPSSLILPAILDYESAPMTVIDPACRHTPKRSALKKLMDLYYK